jgi:CRISPR-associated DxTHG motif protein
VDARNIEVEILPGIGNFKLGDSRYRYSGGVGITMIAMETSLYGRLKRVRPDFVVLDVSHGINYLPLTAAIAVRRAVKMYSSASRKLVSLAILNSDPVTEDDEEASVHIIDSTVFKEDPLPALGEICTRIIESPYRMLVRERPPEKLSRLENEYKQILQDEKLKFREVMRIIERVYPYGLILLLVTKLDQLRNENIDFKAMYERLIGLLREVLGRRNVEVGDGEVRVVDNFTLEPDILNLIYSLELVNDMMSGIPQAIRDIQTPEHVGETVFFKLIIICLFMI